MVEECLELVSRNWNKAIYILFLLVLLLAKTDLVPKERYSKGNIDKPHSSNGSKVIFILLIEVEIVYVGLSTIYIRRSGF